MFNVILVFDVGIRWRRLFTGAEGSSSSLLVAMAWVDWNTMTWTVAAASGVGGVNGEEEEGDSGDWNEAVVFFEAAAAAEAVCCSSDASGQTRHKRWQMVTNDAFNF